MWDLTDEQKAILNHKLPGNARVLAGPGTGKSTTAVAWIEKLVEESEKNGKPIKLKFLTFTRATAIELAGKLSAAKAKYVQPSTIHSFAISILMRNYGAGSFPTPLRIPDDYELDEFIILHLSKKLGFKSTKIKDLISEMSAKWESLDPENKKTITDQERSRFTGAFNEHRRVFGYTLLSELPDLFRRALENHSDLKGLDYDLLIVDEYQDLNACELSILKILADKGISIVSIGDDDQSIYSWRKAHPEGIRKFLKDFTTHADYPLTICQRSPQNMIEWSQHVIVGDSTRQVKKAPSPIDKKIKGTLALLNFKSEVSEAKGVANIITWLHKTKGLPLSEILVLSRSDRYGTFTKKIKEELQAKGIQVNDPGILKLLSEDRSIRILINILRLKIDISDSLAWLNLTKLHHGLGGSFIDKVYSFCIDNNCTFGVAITALADQNFDDYPSKKTAIQFYAQIQDALNKIELPVEKNIDWGNWIIKQIDRGVLPECPEEFKKLLVKIDSLDKHKEQFDLSKYLSSIIVSAGDLNRATAEGVRFMTMGGSKGLTVKATILVGVDHDLLSRPNSNIAEERRLLYVAMTRAREFLFLTWVNFRKGPQARSGTENKGRRNYSDFLEGGPIKSEDGDNYIKGLK